MYVCMYVFTYTYVRMYVKCVHVCCLFLSLSFLLLSHLAYISPIFILPPWCVKAPKIELDLVHLKKDEARCNSVVPW